MLRLLISHKRQSGPALLDRKVVNLIGYDPFRHAHIGLAPLAKQIGPLSHHSSQIPVENGAADPGVVPRRCDFPPK
jgi:hypothetical protein